MNENLGWYAEVVHETQVIRVAVSRASLGTHYTVYASKDSHYACDFNGNGKTLQRALLMVINELVCGVTQINDELGRVSKALDVARVAFTKLKPKK